MRHPRFNILGLLAALALTACTASNITAQNPLTGERAEFADASEVPEGWVVCASSDTCPAPADCTTLDDATCTSRTDCESTEAGCVTAAATCEIERCGEAPGAPAIVCEDGSTGGITGRCIAFGDTCVWERRDCPPDEGDECTPAECGTTPPLFAEMCDDGSTGGNTGRCLQLADGRCDWEIRECPPVSDCSEDECGPAPGAPAFTCEDGSTGGNIGLCERNDAGTCGWVIRECPDTPPSCSDADCGPTPGAPSIVCDDGSTAGPTCEATAGGSCAWVFRECPPAECPSECGGWCSAAADCTLPEGCENPGCRCPEPSCEEPPPVCPRYVRRLVRHPRLRRARRL